MKIFIEHLIYVFIIHLHPKVRNNMMIESVSPDSSSAQSHKEVTDKTKAHEGKFYNRGTKTT